ncbi:MAG: hypothetical protein LBT58_02300 [Endomicrobium sp.]|nr:hypothetical protein [Endomicrobium sp.]
MKAYCFRESKEISEINKRIAKAGKEKTTDKMIKEAMAQIRDKKYYEKYASSDVSLLAIAFGNKKE